MYNQAKIAYQQNNLTLAEELLNRVLDEHPERIEALILRSQVYHKQQQWGKAINDLNAVLEIDPENQLAQNYKTMIKEIIGFWNKDTYNP